MNDLKSRIEACQVELENEARRIGEFWGVQSLEDVSKIKIEESVAQAYDKLWDSICRKHGVEPSFMIALLLGETRDGDALAQD